MNLVSLNPYFSSFVIFNNNNNDKNTYTQWEFTQNVEIKLYLSKN